MKSYAIRCDACRGEGWIESGVCGACDGTGKIPISETPYTRRAYRVAAWVLFLGLVGLGAWLMVTHR